MPGKLDGPGLVGVDVSRVRADDALPGPQGGGDQGGVGGGTAHDKVDLGLCPAQLLQYLRLGLFTPLVRPIAGVALLIGLARACNTAGCAPRL